MVMQPQNNFFDVQVPPGAMSSIKLPQGKYSLASDSTIPFVSLQGGGLSEKVFTWGEMIEVPHGQTVSVKNESYMQGDIQINSGWDPYSKPKKISLPVRATRLVSGGAITVSPTFPVDTRLARTANLVCDIITSLGGTFSYTGKPQKHSFPAADAFSGQSSYSASILLTGVTKYTYLPLGFGTSPNNPIDINTPMGLTDQVLWSLTFNNSPPPVLLNNIFFYVLEY